MGAIETLLAKLGATQNPGYLVAQGVNKITTPGYPADDALRGYVAGAPAFQPTIGGMLKQTGTDLASSGAGFIKSLMAGDYEAAMNNSLFPLGGMTVFHGSPHKFDAFDLSKIGTGEGAQAYGHGLYFAENANVAGQYQKQLAGDLFQLPDGSHFDPATLEHLNVRAGLRKSNGNVDEAITKARQLIANGSAAPEAGRDLAKLEQIKAAGGLSPVKGNLYHVDIPDDEIAKMLDWDKPLSEQPESVRKALNQAFERDLSGETGWQKLTGEKLYKAIQERVGKPDKGASASAALRELGIPGIKYLDGGSRKFQVKLSVRGKPYAESSFATAEQAQKYLAEKASEGFTGEVVQDGTRNFVLFDDNLAKVLKRE